MRFGRGSLFDTIFTARPGSITRVIYRGFPGFSAGESALRAVGGRRIFQPVRAAHYHRNLTDFCGDDSWSMDGSGGCGEMSADWFILLYRDPTVGAKQPQYFDGEMGVLSRTTSLQQ